MTFVAQLVTSAHRRTPTPHRTSSRPLAPASHATRAPAPPAPAPTPARLDPARPPHRHGKARRAFVALRSLRYGNRGCGVTFVAQVVTSAYRPPFTALRAAPSSWHLTPPVPFPRLRLHPPRLGISRDPCPFPACACTHSALARCSAPAPRAHPARRAVHSWRRGHFGTGIEAAAGHPWPRWSLLHARRTLTALSPHVLPLPSSRRLTRPVPCHAGTRTQPRSARRGSPAPRRTTCIRGSAVTSVREPRLRRDIRGPGGHFCAPVPPPSPDAAVRSPAAPPRRAESAAATAGWRAGAGHPRCAGRAGCGRGRARAATSADRSR